MDLFIEQGRRRVFASALDWPGLARSGRDEDLAIERLAAYTSRYGAVCLRAGVAPPEGGWTVVERARGNATTDFGAPAIIAGRDRTGLDRPLREVWREILMSAWAAFDEAASRAGPLRLGPRGGGRQADAIVEHVVDTERVYARKCGAVDSGSGGVKGVGPVREAILERLGSDDREASSWPLRYGIRRITWHVLDHLWEIEDRV